MKENLEDFIDTITIFFLLKKRDEKYNRRNSDKFIEYKSIMDYQRQILERFKKYISEDIYELSAQVSFFLNSVN